jgi:hypothetical protein
VNNRMVIFIALKLGGTVGILCSVLPAGVGRKSVHQDRALVSLRKWAHFVVCAGLGPVCLPSRVHSCDDKNWEWAKRLSGRGGGNSD